MKKISILNDDRGATLIEFVISIPILLLLIASILQFLIIGYTKFLMQNAVSDAARVACVTPQTTKQKRVIFNTSGNNPMNEYAKEIIKKRLSILNLSEEEIEEALEISEISFGINSNEKYLKVQIEYKMPLLSIFKKIKPQILITATGMSRISIIPSKGWWRKEYKKEKR
jgi:hypothetical protein